MTAIVPYMAELLVLSPKPEDFWLASNIRLNRLEPTLDKATDEQEGNDHAANTDEGL